MSVRRHEQQTRTSDSGHGVLDLWLPFCGAGSVETYGGGILVEVEGDAAIPGVFGPQFGVSPGFLCFYWLKQEDEDEDEEEEDDDDDEEEEELTTVQKHSRAGYNIAALLFFFLFLDNLLRRVEGQAWKGFWLCSGRLEVVVLFGMLSLVAQFVYWSRIVSGLWLANCCFAHISLGFPFLLRFCDEQSRHSFCPFP